LQTKTEARNPLLPLRPTVNNINRFKTMEVNRDLKEHLFGIIENQLNDNDPPETKLTYDRLRNDGRNNTQAKELLAQCVAVEIFGVFKSGKSFDEVRYVKNLKRLPKEPLE
jgi:hypothetical protein